MTVKPLTIAELSNLLPRLQATAVHLQQLTKGSSPKRTSEVPTYASTFVMSDASPKSKNKNSREEAKSLRIEIHTLLKRHPVHGMPVGDIAYHTRSTLEAARYALKLLKGERKVKMVGKRATAKWFARK